MLKMLSKKEISCISGGWTCNNTYNGKPFLKAAWHEDKQVMFGTCYYGEEYKEKTSLYSAPSYLTGIVQEPDNYWTFKGDAQGGRYTLYECYRSASHSVSLCSL